MYTIKVNSTHQFKVTETEIHSLDAIETAPKKFHILNKNKSVKAYISESNFNDKTYTVKVNNNSYNVTIHDALDQQIEALGFEIGALKSVNEIKAPMPGLILEINTNEGDNVKEGDPLLILEAMKMENVLTSPREGKIKSIHVKTGQTVDKNALLIEFD